MASRFGSVLFSATVLLTGLLAPSAVLSTSGATGTVTSSTPPALITGGDLSREQAHAAAVASRVRVEVTSERTETESLWANPDGTLTLDVASEPYRTETSTGWRQLDLTLRSDGGKWTPSLGEAEVSFGGGGGTELVRMASGGATLSLDWPSALPVPIVSGSVARYPNAFPGVDLVMTATPTGYTQVLEVSSRSAGTNPALRALDLKARVAGGSLAARGDGYAVVDSLGRPALMSTDTAMWDSTGVGVATGKSASMGPAENAKLGSVGVTPGGGLVKIRPDLTLLDDPKTVYPVYIDPNGTVPWNQSGRSMVFKQYPAMEFWNWANETAHGGQGVGYQNFDGVSTKRLFWQVDLGTKLDGATVISATFIAREVWAASCTKTAIEAWRTGAISSGTNWNNQPAWSAKQDTLTVSHGRENCPPDQAGDRDLRFDVKGAAQWAASNGKTKLTLGLRASSETNAAAWKRFAPKPDGDGNDPTVLSVTFSKPPTAPAESLESPGRTCGTGTARPVIGNDGPLLVAKTKDPEDHEVKVSFSLYSGVGTARTLIGSPFVTTFKDAYTTAYDPYRWDITSRLPKDAQGKLVAGTYSWRAEAIENTSAGLSTFGPWCEFTVDPNAPVEPSVELVSPGPLVFGSSSPPQFRIGPNSSTDVTGYSYKWNSSATPSGGPSIVVTNVGCTALTRECVIAPPLPKSGLNVLYVWAYDAAGNPSITPGSLAIETLGINEQGRYGFNEGSGGTAADTSTDATATPLTVGTGVSWQLRGAFTSPVPPEVTYDEWALRFATQTVPPTAQATAGVVDTTDSFSVSAWVDPASVTVNRYAVSQKGASGAAFRLGVESACPAAGGTTQPCYVFGVWNPATNSYATARSTVEADLTKGYIHLLGVYLKSEGRTILYVDNEASTQGAITAPQTTSSTQFRVGAGTTATGAVDGPWIGDVDHVRAFNWAADPGEVAQLYGEFASFVDVTGP